MTELIRTDIPVVAVRRDSRHAQPVLAAVPDGTQIVVRTNKGVIRFEHATRGGTAQVLRAGIRVLTKRMVGFVNTSQFGIAAIHRAKEPVCTGRRASRLTNPAGTRVVLRADVSILAGTGVRSHRIVTRVQLRLTGPAGIRRRYRPRFHTQILDKTEPVLDLLDTTPTVLR
jgi:hypothetical protein